MFLTPTPLYVASSHLSELQSPSSLCPSHGRRIQTGGWSNSWTGGFLNLAVEGGGGQMNEVFW